MDASNYIKQAGVIGVSGYSIITRVSPTSLEAGRILVEGSNSVVSYAAAGEGFHYICAGSIKLNDNLFEVNCITKGDYVGVSYSDSGTPTAGTPIAVALNGFAKTAGATDAIVGYVIETKDSFVLDDGTIQRAVMINFVGK